METIRPLGEWVLIQVESQDEKRGAIYIPQNTKNRKRRGRVLRVGPGKMLESGKRAEPEVKEGDRVTFLEHNIAQGVLDVDAQEGHCLIPGTEIIGVIERETMPA